MLTSTLGGTQFLEVQGEYELPHSWVCCLPGLDALFIYGLDKEQRSSKDSFFKMNKKMYWPGVVMHIYNPGSQEE